MIAANENNLSCSNHNICKHCNQTFTASTLRPCSKATEAISENETPGRSNSFCEMTRASWSSSMCFCWTWRHTKSSSNKNVINENVWKWQFFFSSSSSKLLNHSVVSVSPTDVIYVQSSKTLGSYRASTECHKLKYHFQYMYWPLHQGKYCSLTFGHRGIKCLHSHFSWELLFVPNVSISSHLLLFLPQPSKESGTIHPLGWLEFFTTWVLNRTVCMASCLDLLLSPAHPNTTFIDHLVTRNLKFLEMKKKIMLCWTQSFKNLTCPKQIQILEKLACMIQPWLALINSDNSFAPSLSVVLFLMRYQQFGPPLTFFLEPTLNSFPQHEQQFIEQWTHIVSDSWKDICDPPPRNGS